MGRGTAMAREDGVAEAAGRRRASGGRRVRASPAAAGWSGAATAAAAAGRCRTAAAAAATTPTRATSASSASTRSASGTPRRCATLHRNSTAAPAHTHTRTHVSTAVSGGYRVQLQPRERSAGLSSPALRELSGGVGALCPTLGFVGRGGLMRRERVLHDAGAVHHARHRWRRALGNAGRGATPPLSPPLRCVSCAPARQRDGGTKSYWKHRIDVADTVTDDGIQCSRLEVRWPCCTARTPAVVHAVRAGGRLSGGAPLSGAA